MAVAVEFLLRLRMALVAVGVLVWVPFMIARYILHDPFPVGWVLAIHIPCMIGALALRIWQGCRASKGGSNL